MSASLDYYRLQFPSDLPLEAVQGGLLALTGLSRPGRSVAHRFEVTGTRDGLEHRLGLAPQVGATALRQLGAVPGLVLTPTEPSLSPSFAWRLWASTGRRPLAGTAESTARALLVALGPELRKNERLGLHWLLGPVRRPMSVGAKHPPVVSESWPLALVTAAVRLPGDLDAEARRRCATNCTCPAGAPSASSR